MATLNSIDDRHGHDSTYATGAFGVVRAIGHEAVIAYWHAVGGEGDRATELINHEVVLSPPSLR